MQAYINYLTVSFIHFMLIEPKGSVLL